MYALYKIQVLYCSYISGYSFEAVLAFGQLGNLPGTFRWQKIGFFIPLFGIGSIDLLLFWAGWI